MLHVFSLSGDNLVDFASKIRAGKIVHSRGIAVQKISLKWATVSLYICLRRAHQCPSSNSMSGCDLTLSSSGSPSSSDPPNCVLDSNSIWLAGGYHDSVMLRLKSPVVRGGEN